jgi:hypothetical protein
MNLDDDESPVNQLPLDDIGPQPSSPHNDEPQGNAGAMDIDGHQGDGTPAPIISTQQHQTVLSFNMSMPTSAPTLVIAHPMTTTTKKEATRCALCVQALCNLRFSCKGYVKRAWCTCNHPPVVGRKVRWSENQVKHRLALRDAGQGSGQT